MAQSAQEGRTAARRVVLYASLAVLLGTAIGGSWMVASILEGFGSDAVLAPVRFAAQMLLQLPPFAMLIVVLVNVCIGALLARMLAVPRLRASTLWYVLPGAILLVSLYWYLSCRGVVTMIERMSQ